MEIAAPSMAEVDDIADLWVDLARGQRSHGSHVEPEANRATVRETVARHVVTGGVLAAYTSGDEDESDGGGAGDADGTLVGFVTFAPESGGYASDCERGVIQNIYVAPDARGEGVGSALLSAAEAALVDAGMDVVSLEVMARNEEARRFYARHGYRDHRVELEKRPRGDDGDVEVDAEVEADGNDEGSESDTDSKVDR